ncbi:1-pyrroline-5-carboxylate dehydrogenase [Bosea thiooxidans]
MAAPASHTAMPPFRAPFAEDDGAIAGRLLASARRDPAAKARIDARATGLIEAIRTRKVGLGGIEELLREYSLSTKEGLALMVLAEALLRVPDATTADRLIEDKLGQGDFAHHESKSDAFLVSASAWALGITARVIQPGETPTGIRAAALRKAADIMETRRGLLIALLQSEAGQTIDDAISELRETVDFCRYYAAQAEEHFAAPTVPPGPTGEENRLILRGRGAFVCIAPWNFPLAIFTGQVVAALVAGNSVVAKPAPQTPIIATVAIKILHEAGVPVTALHLVPGGTEAGAALVAHKDVAGVAQAGSRRRAPVPRRRANAGRPAAAGPA